MSEGHWQLEGSAAELFQRYLVPAITFKWAEDLVRRAQLRTGELGRVDEFWRDDVFGIPELNQT